MYALFLLCLLFQHQMISTSNGCTIYISTCYALSKCTFFLELRLCILCTRHFVVRRNDPRRQLYKILQWTQYIAARKLKLLHLRWYSQIIYHLNSRTYYQSSFIYNTAVLVKKSKSVSQIVFQNFTISSYTYNMSSTYYTHECNVLKLNSI